MLCSTVLRVSHKSRMGLHFTVYGLERRADMGRFGRGNLEESLGYKGISPRRVAFTTASVRLWAFSLLMMEVTWNFTVCSLMSSS